MTTPFLRFSAASALTLGNAGCGFAGILVLALIGRDEVPIAVALVFAAWIFDTFDGMVARRLGVSGPFGAMLDSVCDVVSFGVLPGLIAVVVAGDSRTRVLAVACAAGYLAGALLRLSRYTVKAVHGREDDGRFWFEGLSSPAAAMAVGAAALALPDWAVALAAALSAALMVSTVAYPDLTTFYVRGAIPRWTLLIPIAAVIVVDWQLVLLAGFALYIAAGPWLPLRSPRRTPSGDR